MRRLVVAFVVLFLLVLAGTVAALYVFRDALLLSQLNARAAALAPAKLHVASLRTSVLGAFELTLGGVDLSRDGISLQVKEARVSSPLSLLGLYRAWSAKTEIPLSLALTGASAKLPPSPAGSAPKSEKEFSWPRKLELPPLPSVPVRADLTLKGGELLGAVQAKDAQAKLDLRSTGAALEAAGQLRFEASLPGAEALLPVSLDLKLSASAERVLLQNLAFRAAGIEGTGSGELAPEPVVAKFALDAAVPDLAKLSLRPEDRAALGLTAQPSGAFSLKVAGVAQEGSLRAGGQLKLVEGKFPLRFPEKTIFAGAAAGSKVEGDVKLHAEAPAFQLEAPLGGGKGAMKLTGTLTAAADLTGARVEKAGMLAKPAGVPLRAELNAKIEESGAKIESLSALFHTLSLRASGELSQPLGKLVSGTFRAEAKSLAGFPALLPVLREQNASGASLDEARGEVLAEGRARFLPETPARSLVELRTLSLKGVRLPLAYRKDKIAATGLLLASVTGAGRYDAGALDVSKGEGSADLTGLALELPGLVKKQGKKLLVTFDARGNPARLNLRKATLQADGLTASLSGTISTAVRGRADLALTCTLSAELAPLREYLPKLPMKVSNGSMSADAKVGGSWLFEGGVSSSPLLVSANARGKVGSVEMPEAADGAGAAEKKKPEPLLPPWPVARKLRLGYRFELGSFKRGALEASGIVAEGRLDEGKFLTSLTVAKTFGGSARLTRVSGDLTQAALPVRGEAMAEGMDLSRMASFVDPSYGQIVKGTLKADSSFSVPDLWSEQLLSTATTKGRAEIQNGYVSTASLDQMVNAKLAGIPGLGDKAKVSTGGMAADMRTNFEVASGVAKLSDFLAVTPRKDEMSLAGTLDLAFNADMKGEARLVDAPVRGAVREANSDEQGRLVVPIVFRGNLKNPSVDIANETIERMLGKTATHEANKLKDKAVNEGKKKLEEEAKKAGQDLLKGIFKR